MARTAFVITKGEPISSQQLQQYNFVPSAFHPYEGIQVTCFLHPSQHMKAVGLQ